MSDQVNHERGKDPSEGADETAHPFDQTNGTVEGLEGDADSPEQAEKRTRDGEGGVFLAAPAPGSQMAGGVIPPVADNAPDADAGDGADADSDDPTPA